MFYARKIDFNLKSGQEKDFTRTFETKVLPFLQKQPGFQDELVLTKGHTVMAISVWDTRKNAEAYEKTAYPKVLETLKPLMDKTPKIETFDVIFDAHHAIA